MPLNRVSGNPMQRGRAAYARRSIVPARKVVAAAGAGPRAVAAGPAPAPIARTLTPADLITRLYGSILTPQQQRAEATRTINLALAGQRQTLQDAAREEQAVAERQARAAEGFARSFAPIQQAIDTQIHNAYTGAADEVS